MEIQEIVTTKEAPQKTSTEMEADSLKRYVDAGTIHCVICNDPVPELRMRRRAVTCCEAHAKVADEIRRRKRNQTKCRLCNRPATPEEVADFRAWKRERGLLAKRGRPKAAAAGDLIDRALEPDDGELLFPL